MNTKNCCKCKENKSKILFHKNKRKKDGLQDSCISCKKDSNEQTRLKSKETNGLKVIDYLISHPCIRCGETDPLVLDFDHLDIENKIMSISDLVVSGAKWKRIDAEMYKCRVLCKNCHYRHTAEQFNHPRLKLLKLYKNIVPK